MPVALSAGRWIHYRELGGGGADPVPVLLLMGLGGSGRLWWRLEPHLAPSWRLLVPDQRGTGLSDRLSRPLTMRTLLADALAVLDDAGAAQAHVVGISLGGMVAQRLALDHRERVRSLLLAATTAQGRRLALRLPWREAAIAAARPLLGADGTVRRMAPALYGPATVGRRPERIDEDMVERGIDPTPTVTAAAQLAVAAGHDVRGRLAELRGLPVTVVHGEADRLIGVAHGRALAAAIPGAESVMIPGAGHLLVTDAEQAIARAVAAHLRRADPRSTAPSGVAPKGSNAGPVSPR
ncbi:alpha/beta fold hydrolase [Patulibacter defluvii]|uniref:alpha/beta fold hydrolase n=1 Tax=Patulibacter defluvii TaxID=3095358 RepID=UPI002A75D73B|nr:alpha/beta fold hydrolase [Patulibacter sp. DM4]